jgi:hypothetical protein
MLTRNAVTLKDAMSPATVMAMGSDLAARLEARDSERTGKEQGGRGGIVAANVDCN